MNGARPNIFFTIIGGVFMLSLVCAGLGMAFNAAEAAFFPEQHAKKKATAAAEFQLTQRAQESAMAAKESKAVAEQELVDAAFDLLKLDQFYPYSNHAEFVPYFRKKIEAAKRYENAALNLHGADWRKVLATEHAETGAFAAMKAGMPREEAYRDLDTLTYKGPSSTDISPYRAIMNVKYRPTDDKSYEPNTLNQKLQKAAATYDGSHSAKSQEWQEYLRCELSYAINGGHVSKRPIAKPCEDRIDAILGESTDADIDQTYETTTPTPR